MDYETKCFPGHRKPYRREIIFLIAHYALTPNAAAEKFDVSRRPVDVWLESLQKIWDTKVNQFDKLLAHIQTKQKKKKL